MPTQLLKKSVLDKSRQSTRILAAENPSAAGMKELAKEFIRQAARHHASSPLHNGGDEEDVILDIEVEGVRCLLIRTQLRAVNAPITLSPREQEIVRMIAKGYPNKTIAAVLDISAWTVCTHIRRVFAKLGVGSRAAMVAKLLEDGSIAGVTTASAQSTIKFPD